jgi:transcriptional coactivator p15 (PC4)
MNTTEGNSGRPQSNDPVVIAEWRLNRGERLRVSIEEFKGSRLISIRKWFTTNGGELRPTSRGISMAVRHLPQLTAAVEDALTFASERGLVEIRRLDDSGLGGVARERLSGGSE